MTSTATYHPIAECGATTQETAADYDRRWLLCNSGGQWMRRALYPRMAEIEVQIKAGYLVLRAPGMLRLDIIADVEEDDESVQHKILLAQQTVDVVDEGDLAAAWMSNFVGIPCRLFKLNAQGAPVQWPAEDA